MVIGQRNIFCIWKSLRTKWLGSRG